VGPPRAPPRGGADAGPAHGRPRGYARAVSYLPGHTSTAVDFMAARTAESHAAFFLPELARGQRLLDCGCGPGTITVGLAQRVAPGEVIGVDLSSEQFGRGRALAREAGLHGVRFIDARVDRLPLDDNAVDRVFAHALMEHLAAPEAALAELRRVLAPGGRIGLCSPDWGGFLVGPPSAALDAALAAYVELQAQRGGDPHIGRRLGALLLAAGYRDVRLDARYEVYADPGRIAGYLAEQLAAAGADDHARTLREWAGTPAALFAQAWVSAVAGRP